jgi:hypothetical protein
MDPGVQQILYPVIVATLAFTAFVLLLVLRDGYAPFFHVGFICASVTLIYVALPPLFFVLAGLDWSNTSDHRLLRLGVTEDEISDYAWRGVLYLSSFCLMYLLVVWNQRKPMLGMPIAIARLDVAICGSILVACLAYQTAVEVIFGVSLIQSNADLANDPASQSLPLIVAQMTHNILGIQRIAKLALVVVLVSLWQKNWAKIALAAWFLVELFSTVVLLGPRTYFALLVLGALLSFHRIVRPFSLPILAASGALCLAFLLLYGYMRDFSEPADFSTSNEFQTLMGTALHVSNLVESGLIAPAQVVWSELLMLIPQQLLPVEKIDPANWYLIESGLAESGTGYMFGVQSQANVGLGNWELFGRAIVLALVLGFLHRQYAARSSSFLLTVSYIWLMTSIYYSYRATTFYWVTFAAYRLLVFVGIVLIARHALKRLAPNTTGFMAIR